METNSPDSRINRKNSLIFLALSFSLTWGLNLLLWRTIGLQGDSRSLLLLQLQMLLPAFSAILLMRFIFHTSPIHCSNYRQKPIIFYYFFLAMVIIFLGMVIWSFIEPSQITLITAISGGINLIMIMALITIRMMSNRQEFSAAWLSGGRIRDWLMWGTGFVVFYTLTTVLNRLFNLGEMVDLRAIMEQLQVPADISPTMFLILMIVQTVIMGSLLGIIFGFGEEFGWRGFLQSELFKSGRIRGVFILGLIWGVWHYPVIWMGHNYPGQPVWGSAVMTAYTVLLGIVLSYVMLKTRAIWLVAFLHAINNQTLAFLNSFIYQVKEPINSFSIGVWGLFLVLPIVFILLRDPIWRTND